MNILHYEGLKTTDYIHNELQIIHLCSLLCPFWAADPKGTESYRTQGEFVRPYVCLFVHPPWDLIGWLSPLEGWLRPL